MHKHERRTSDSLVHANGPLKLHVAPGNALHLSRKEKVIAEERHWGEKVSKTEKASQTKVRGIA